MPAHILLVEDRESLRRMIALALESQGHQVTAVADGEAGIASLEAADFDLLLSDLKLPGTSGLDVLAAARRLRPALPVVVMTAYGTVSAAVEAMKLGAADFLEKPVDLDELDRLVGVLVGGTPGDAVFTTPTGTQIVGRHPRIRAALRLLQRVAPTDSTVLLTGASGTGKELFARAVHELSPRAAGPFVAVNCAAIPRELLENELFGHEKGAFTGAHRRQTGRFELAHGGTLFLDEIGDLDLAVQSKVLRVLEERTFERVGGGATLKAEVRLVAATNQDLVARSEAGLFRRDLFFRLEVFPVELPALAERASDIPLLAEHLLGRIAARLGRTAPRLQAEAEAVLAAQPWPGNVRQLANVLERGVVVVDRPVWTAADLVSLLGPMPGGEAEAVRDALRRSAGDKKRAAQMLGVSYRTLQRRVRELDLEGFPKYRD
jgi:DNA-binding NtrC family response regulator